MREIQATFRAVIAISLLVSWSAAHATNCLELLQKVAPRSIVEEFTEELEGLQPEFAPSIAVSRQEEAQFLRRWKARLGAVDLTRLPPDTRLELLTLERYLGNGISGSTKSGGWGSSLWTGV